MGQFATRFYGKAETHQKLSEGDGTSIQIRPPSKALENSRLKGCKVVKTAWNQPQVCCSLAKSSNSGKNKPKPQSDLDNFDKLLDLIACLPSLVIVGAQKVGRLLFCGVE